MDSTTAEQILIQWGYLPVITPYTTSLWLEAARENQQLVLEAYLAIGMNINAVQRTSALIIAVEKNYLALAEWLIERGIDLELRDESDDTALQTAVNWKDRIPFLHLLIKHGANINCINRKDMTPLIKAISDERLDVVQILLAAGADPHFKGDTSHYPPLYHAHLATPAIFEAVLHAGANPHIEVDGLPLLLHCATMKDQTIAHAYLTSLLQAGADPNQTSENGWTVRLLAEYLRYDTLLPLLEAHGAHPVDLTPYQGLQACRENQPEVLKAWLTLGHDINQRDLYGNTALIIAAKNGHLDCVKLLLAAGADANIVNKHANALMWAISNKHEACGRMLLPYTHIFGFDGETSALVSAVKNKLALVQDLIRADINGRNSLNQTAALLAANQGDLETLQWLIARGADLTLADKQGYTPLMVGVLKQPPIARYLLEHFPDKIAINAQNDQGQTALHLAMRDAKGALVTALLETGADWRVTKSPTNTSALDEAYGTTGKEVAGLFKDFILQRLQHRAEQVMQMLEGTADQHDPNLFRTHFADYNDPVTLQILIEEGQTDLFRALMYTDLDVNAVRVKYHWTLLHLACSVNMPAIIAILLHRGADPNLTLPDSLYTPLHFAKSYEAVHLLVAAGANVNQPDRDGGTPLESVSGKNDLDAIKLLVHKGAAINPHPAGISPLWRACQNQNVAGAIWLLEQGANPNILPKSRESALHVAVSKKSAVLVEALVQHGAHLNRTNMQGDSPIMIAAREGFVAGFTYLLNAGAGLTLTNKAGLSLPQIARNRPEILQALVVFTGKTITAEPLKIEPLPALPPLLAAVVHQDIAAVERHQQDVNTARSYRGDTALILACALGHLEIVNLLLAVGADIHLVNHMGENAWVYAATNQFKAIEGRLLELGAKLDAMNLMPAHMMRRENFTEKLTRGELQTVKQMVQTGVVNVDVILTADATPLCMAILKHDLGMVQLLLSIGANPEIRSKNNISPLELASHEGQLQIIQLLLEAGVKIRDERPILAAINRQHEAVVRYLYTQYQQRGIPLDPKIELWVQAMTK